MSSWAVALREEAVDQPLQLEERSDQRRSGHCRQRSDRRPPDPCGSIPKPSGPGADIESISRWRRGAAVPCEHGQGVIGDLVTDRDPKAAGAECGVAGLGIGVAEHDGLDTRRFELGDREISIETTGERSHHPHPWHQAHTPVWPAHRADLVPGQLR